MENANTNRPPPETPPCQANPFPPPPPGEAPPTYDTATGANSYDPAPSYDTVGNQPQGGMVGYTNCGPPNAFSQPQKLECICGMEEASAECVNRMCASCCKLCAGRCSFHEGRMQQFDGNPYYADQSAAVARQAAAKKERKRRERPSMATLAKQRDEHSRPRPRGEGFSRQDEKSDDSVMSLPGGSCKHMIYEWVAENSPEFDVPAYNSNQCYVDDRPTQVRKCCTCPCNSCLGITAGFCNAIPPACYSPCAGCKMMPGICDVICRTKRIRTLLRCTCCTCLPANCVVMDYLFINQLCGLMMIEGCMASVCVGPGTGMEVTRAIGASTTNYLKTVSSAPLPKAEMIARDDENDPRAELWPCLAGLMCPCALIATPVLSCWYTVLGALNCPLVSLCCFQTLMEDCDDRGRCVKVTYGACCAMPCAACLGVAAICDSLAFGCFRGGFTPTKTYNRRYTDSYCDVYNYCPNYVHLCGNYSRHFSGRADQPIDENYFLVTYMDKHIPSDWFFLCFGWYYFCSDCCYLCSCSELMQCLGESMDCCDVCDAGCEGCDSCISFCGDFCGSC